MGFTSYLISRLLQSILVLLGVSTVVFFLIRLSGDPVLLLVPADAGEADILALRAKLGFDQPVYVQYWLFLQRALVFDFGASLRYQQPAMSLVLERFPATLELSLAALVMSTVIAVPVGVITAVKRDSIYDNVAMLIALLGQSMPVFWTGIMLIVVVSVGLGLFPSSGKGGIEYLVLPAFTLGLFSIGRVTRLVRGSMLEVLGQDYVRTARAKGLLERSVLYRHALRNCLLPVLTIVGLQLTSLLAGAVVVETVFAWPGIGRLSVAAIFARDYPVVQAVVFVVAAVFVVVNLAVDLLYAFVDPRIRYG